MVMIKDLHKCPVMFSVLAALYYATRLPGLMLLLVSMVMVMRRSKMMMVVKI